MAFEFHLERPDGTPAEPAVLSTAVPNWEPGHTIPLGKRTLHVVAVRPSAEPGANPVLVVEDVAEADVA
jgi:hypothetical protein